MKREFYALTLPPFFAAILLVGCLQTTNHNPMKRPAPSEEKVVTAPAEPSAESTSKCTLFELLKEAREAVDRFRTALKEASDEELEEFKKLVEGDGDKLPELPKSKRVF